jgi:hypothetical protein
MWIGTIMCNVVTIYHRLVGLKEYLSPLIATALAERS